MISLFTITISNNPHHVSKLVKYILGLSFNGLGKRKLTKPTEW